MTDPVTGPGKGREASLASELAAELVRVLAELFDETPARLGLAVSGGGDSLALLHLMRDWAAPRGVALSVATVDHGLRPEAAAEAAGVADLCARLGLPHRTLRWQGWDGHGNLSDAARRGRYGLLADWARGQGIAAVALGHTRDDQAETVLMRLARGSGVDGLSAMALSRAADGVLWLRPLLGASRAALRDLLRARGQTWVEDPSNDDPAYDRVKARRALAALAPLGIEAAGLVETAARMARARAALDHLARDLSVRALTIELGDVVIARAALLAAPEETRLRLVAAALGWVGAMAYRPRLAALEAALSETLLTGAGRRRTLSGCLLIPTKRSLRVTREARAVASLETPADQLWDERWRLTGPVAEAAARGLSLRALGAEGLALCTGWRAGALPRASLIAAPALWQGARLIAAPLAGFAGQGEGQWGLVAEIDPHGALGMLLSH